MNKLFTLLRAVFICFFPTSICHQYLLFKISILLGPKYICSYNVLSYVLNV